MQGRAGAVRTPGKPPTVSLFFNLLLLNFNRECIIISDDIIHKLNRRKPKRAI
jgi:hypothetical protein